MDCGIRPYCADEANSPASDTPHFSAPFAASQQTPWTFNTGSAVDSSDQRLDVDSKLRTEIENNIIIDRPMLFDTFFGQRSQVPVPGIAAAVFDKCMTREPPLYTASDG
ncbi:hypothetical protein BDY21DRAFT_174837 [Lineolata rhizophorae]|uniref:Uncharacterized protein n=1 Tax=Lineolata rhizophorae TaxID=578093 RepID=A0A6A6NKT1_9PEZI|nr:hypothetical protein BDY21DRAFT_174837 [Lineolata rhizophorae]